MEQENYITASCIISKNTVRRNGVMLFSAKGDSAVDFLNAVYKHFQINYSRFYKMDNLSKLGWLASEVLLKDSFERDKYQPEEVGLVLSNTNSSLDTDLRYMESVHDIASPSLFVYTLPNIVTGEICIRNNFKGEGAFFVFDSFNADFLANYVSGLLNNNNLKACICGWVDLIGDDYKAALFTIEKTKLQNAVPFTAANMNALFEDKGAPLKTQPFLSTGEELKERLNKPIEFLEAPKSESPDVYIAGAGVISAIGNNVEECLHAFENMQAGIGDITLMNTVHNGKLPVAEVKLTNKELAKLTGFPEEISRTALLSFMAAKEALNDAAIPDISALRTGFISANTVGGMDKSEAFFVDFLADNSKGRLRNIFDHECGSITETVAAALGLTNHMTTISTACSSSANAIAYGARLIKNDILDVVVAGGVDALTKFTLNGFNTLMILDKEFCKPFDENRGGLNLGEGAGYLVLVSEKIAKTLQKPLYAKLSGYNNSNDAYHQTASSPDGTGSYLAMTKALKKSGLQPQDINYINLHGTGTPNNDSSEGIAIKRLFDLDYPPMSSTKSFTGHTLGASGGIEAVFSVLAIRHGLIYPNLRFETQMEELPFAPEDSFLKDRKINHVMSNSFGFGGNCTSLIFSKV